MARSYTSSVSPKGQITLPAEIRRELGLKPRDRVEIVLEDGMAKVRPRRSRLLEFYGAAGRLRRPMEWNEVTQTVWDEAAEHTAREGLEE
ncbi:MAG TPA: AbrB/MazE/SpoVT family DNA-binding domain-containing protein [Chloroflexota bacterium]|jgi:AbrB family looped-hinge helix DNA binding protein|nr:AbrB/MazE/SpoVT family DNA-binding domain-containing protein [Chloroflexota bacterium]